MSFFASAVTAIGRFFTPMTEDERKSTSLKAKYSHYNSEYAELISRLGSAGSFNPLGPPQLLDALYSGSFNPGRHTFSKYTQEIEADIPEILRLMPETLRCVMGQARCRENLFPLAIACINPEVPMSIIELLMEKGANYSQTYLVDGSPRTILVDLQVMQAEGRITETRLIEITAIFKSAMEKCA